jgi:hypothetical protein
MAVPFDNPPDPATALASVFVAGQPRPELRGHLSLSRR